MINFKLYGTSGCHLCKSALTIVQSFCDSGINNQHETTIDEIDIVDNDALYDQYQTLIPVLEVTFNKTETAILHWPFTLMQLESTITIQQTKKKPA